MFGTKSTTAKKEGMSATYSSKRQAQNSSRDGRLARCFAMDGRMHVHITQTTHRFSRSTTCGIQHMFGRRLLRHPREENCAAA